MITVIAEHSVDLDLLPEKANILDLGCRGFLWTNYFRQLGHNVFTVDPDPEVKPGLSDKHYRIAITDYNGIATLIKSNDPQATRIEAKMKLGRGPDDVKCSTLASFSKMVGVKFWDLIKIDVEGSEYEIIKSMNNPRAKQLSIEFHLHTGIYGLKEVAEMRDKLESLGYTTVKHDMTKQHGMGLNFWDSLFCL